MHFYFLSSYEDVDWSSAISASDRRNSTRRHHSPTEIAQRGDLPIQEASNDYRRNTSSNVPISEPRSETPPACQNLETRCASEIVGGTQLQYVPEVPAQLTGITQSHEIDRSKNFPNII